MNGGLAGNVIAIAFGWPLCLVVLVLATYAWKLERRGARRVNVTALVLTLLAILVSGEPWSLTLAGGPGDFEWVLDHGVLWTLLVAEVLLFAITIVTFVRMRRRPGDRREGARSSR